MQWFSSSSHLILLVLPHEQQSNKSRGCPGMMMGLGKRAPHSISEGGKVEDLLNFFLVSMSYKATNQEDVLPCRNDDGPWQESWQLEQLHSPCRSFRSCWRSYWSNRSCWSYRSCWSSYRSYLSFWSSYWSVTIAQCAKD